MMDRSSTLNDALKARAADTRRGFSFVRAGASAGEPAESTLSFARIAEEAGRRASALAASGLTPGDRVVIVVPDPQDFVLAFLGAVSGGFVPVPMFPPIAARDLARFEDGVAHIARVASAKARITSSALHATLSPHAAKDAKDAVPVITTEALAAHGSVADIAHVAPESLAFLQFTSGSTARPKGVMVSHANLAANALAFMHEGLRSDPEIDHGVSWLPLFHDMGLIGFVVGPLFADVPVTFLPTASFVRRPLIWLATIAKKRGTITYAPNFAYELVAKRLKPQEVEELDLSSLKHAGCGAEPISAETLRTFAEKLRPAGFDPASFLPSYGMAEATLAITFGGYRRGVRTDVVSASTLEQGKAVAPKDSEDRAQEVVSCGTPFAGHELAIWTGDMSTSSSSVRLAATGEVGHIMVRGPSIASGYFADDERTAAAFGRKGPAADGVMHADWLATGDLGYLRGGELYVCGREKDLIIVRGRNYYPSDIEWAVSDVDGARKGAVVAFSVRGAGDSQERVVLVAEAATADPAALRAEIQRVVLSLFSIQVDSVELIRAGGLPRTSSGKLQRSKTKEMFLAGALPHLRAEARQDADPDAAQEGTTRSLGSQP